MGGKAGRGWHPGLGPPLGLREQGSVIQAAPSVACIMVARRTEAETVVRCAVPDRWPPLLRGWTQPGTG